MPGTAFSYLTPETRLMGRDPRPSEKARERPRAASFRGRRGAGAGLSLAAAAAAAAAVVALWIGSLPAESWVVLESVDGELDDGRPLDAGHRFPFGTLVTPGIGSADVQLGESLRIFAPPGARVELPPGPGRWIGRSRALRVEEGQIFATTGARPLGFERVVVSPETRARIDGTTFAVLRNDAGTRVGLWEGQIRAESPDGVHAVDVPAGMRVQFFAGGLEPAMAPLSDEERTRLQALHEAGLARAVRLPGARP
jgi:hypothetical protein